MNLVEKHVLEFPGHRSAPACPDCPVVQFHYGGDFRRRAGEKRFIRNIDLVPGQAFFLYFDAQVAGEHHDGVTGHAFQGGGQVRGVNHAVAYDKDVLAAALCDIAFIVQQQRLVVTAFQRFVQGKDGIDVMADGLGLAHGDVHVVPCEGRRPDADALLQSLIAQVGAPFPGGNRHVNAEVVRAQAHSLGAVKSDGPDISRRQGILSHHRDTGFVNFVEGTGQAHPQDVRRTLHAAGVVMQPENSNTARRLVGAHAFENPHAVMQRVGKHVHVRLPPGNQFAVKPDDAVAISHCHVMSPSTFDHLPAFRKFKPQF